MLDGLDVVVVDLQDVGARFYTYPRRWPTSWRKRRRGKLPIIVLDRPNPIDGFDIEGPAQDAGRQSLRRLPADAAAPRPDDRRAGAAVQRREPSIGADLTVVPMKNWQRDDWFDDTGARRG